MMSPRSTLASLLQRAAKVADHSSEQHKGPTGQQSEKLEFARTLVLSDPTLGGDEVKINFRDQATVRCDESIQADVSLLPRAFFEYYQRNRKDDGDVARALVETLEDGAPTWLPEDKQPKADEKVARTAKDKLKKSAHLPDHWDLPGTGPANSCSSMQKHSTKISMWPFRWKLIGGLVITNDEGKSERRATAEEFLVLACIMLELARVSREEYFEPLAGRSSLHRGRSSGDLDYGILGYGDSSGATPVHNLLLSNDPACLLIAYHMFKVWPGLMLQSHEKTFDQIPKLPKPTEESPFKGENCLHIVIINGREALACRMIYLARTESLDTINRLVTKQLEGAFFCEARKELRHLLNLEAGGGEAGGGAGKSARVLALPLACYGGTPLGFCAARGMSRALGFMLTMKKANFSLYEPHCELTGFLPIHAVVALGSTKMIDRMLVLEPSLRTNRDDREEGQRASDKQKPDTVAPRNLGVRTVKLSRGPVLSGSARLVADKRAGLAKLPRPGHSPLQLAVYFGRQDMFKHLLRKQTTLRWSWGLLREYEIDLNGVDDVGSVNDVLALVSSRTALESTRELITDGCMQGFLFRLFVDKWRHFGRRLHYLLLVLDVAHFAILARIVEILKTEQDSDVSVAIHRTRPYNIVLLIMLGLQTFEQLSAATTWWQQRRVSDPSFSDKCKKLMKWLWSQKVHVQLLSVGFSTAAASILLIADTADGRSFDAIWVMLSLAGLMQGMEVTHHLLAPIESVGILMQIVYRMVSKDFSHFMVVFIAFLAMFWFAMYAVYPDKQTTAMPDFNEPAGSSFFALFQLASVGETLEVDLWDEHKNFAAQPGTWLEADLCLFTAYYVLFIFVGVILLLNLLIAMMGETYENTKALATLEWRIEFARRVRRLEIIASSSFSMYDEEDLMAGEKPKENSYHNTTNGLTRVHYEIVPLTRRKRTEERGSGRWGSRDRRTRTETVDADFFGFEDAPIVEDDIEAGSKQEGLFDAHLERHEREQGRGDTEVRSDGATGSKQGPTDGFEVGRRVSHATRGTGTVRERMKDGKIRVRFDNTAAGEHRYAEHKLTDKLTSLPFTYRAPRDEHWVDDPHEDGDQPEDIPEQEPLYDMLDADATLKMMKPSENGLRKNDAYMLRRGAPLLLPLHSPRWKSEHKDLNPDTWYGWEKEKTALKETEVAKQDRRGHGSPLQLSRQTQLSTPGQQHTESSCSLMPARPAPPMQAVRPLQTWSPITGDSAVAVGQHLMHLDPQQRQVLFETLQQMLQPLSSSAAGAAPRQAQLQPLGIQPASPMLPRVRQLGNLGGR